MITSLAHDLLPATVTLPTDQQRLFLLFLVGTLVDLVVLGQFAASVDEVYVDSFTTLILAAILLQMFVKLTTIAQRRVLHLFDGRSTAFLPGLKFFVSWLILFFSKFVILEALNLILGDKILFFGAMDGAVWLMAVVLTMIVVEEAIVRLFRKLG